MKFRYRKCTYDTKNLSAEEMELMADAIEQAILKEAEKKSGPIHFDLVEEKPKKKKGH